MDDFDWSSLGDYGDMGGFDISSLDSVDLGSLLDNIDPSIFEGLDQFNLDSVGGLDELLSADFSEAAANLDTSSFSPNVLEDIGALSTPDDLFGVNPDVYVPTGTDLWEQELGSFDRGLADRYASDVQDLGATMSPTDDAGLLKLSGYDEGRLPSQWQTVEGTDLKVMVQDDGTAIGMNPSTGTTFSLTPDQVNGLVQQKKINTFGSGYNTATGGNRVAPGGGTRMPDGSIKKPDGTIIRPDGTVKLPDGKVVKPGAGPTAGTDNKKKSLLETLMPLLLAALVTRRNSGSKINTQPVLPKLTAEQRQTPYTQMQQAPGYRPGQGGVRYFEPLTYTQRMAGGGIIDLAKALAAKRREQRKGLLQGRGDGVSDSIPATIDGERPARLARGEYVVDARTVAELGNGSTDAGAERLDEMRKRVLQKRKKAKVGQDSKARQDLPE